jgi:hypothetical protein
VKHAAIGAAMTNPAALSMLGLVMANPTLAKLVARVPQGVLAGSHE